MNVATRVLLQQMESDIADLKRHVQVLEQRLNGIEAESRETTTTRKTLSLPEKLKPNG